jgi:phytoene synthase
VARDTSFYYAFLALPRDRRDGIVTLWDFCRAADDAVDDELSQERAAAGLALWRSELSACYDGGAPATELGRRLQAVVRRFELPRQPFEDLLDGMAMDLTQKRYETFNDLYRYCLRVASAVGLLSVEIFGYRSAAARDYAVELGIALQLTNVLRDVKADLARDRIYIPLEDLREYGVTEEDLRAAASGPMPPRVRELLAACGGRARHYFERARRALPREDTRRLVSAEIMGAIYFALLKRIERARYDVFSRRISVPRATRAVVAVRTWARVMARPLWT